ncbi:hypothetical protein ACIBCM_19770 [Streptomyces sp. NPDC051018]|uniref:hypothetical protein n=1 Tax=Streptomyces sp. NPDC051018 TaxID=3365639 RepID=UPI0037AF27B4
MPLHPEGMLTTGPLIQIVGAAASGPDPLEWQVLRFQRTTRTEYWEASWRHPLQPLASQLDYLAMTLTPELFARCPPAEREMWTKAADGRPITEFMTDLAMLLRLTDRQADTPYDEVPLAGWEARARFPLLMNLDAWAYDGEYGSFAESHQNWLDNEHPNCEWDVVPMLGQAVEALALVSRFEGFGEALLAHASGATAATLSTVVALGAAHLKDRHRA